MAETTLSLEHVVRGVRSRADLAPLLVRLGLDPILEPVPERAWPAYGLFNGLPARALVVAGRAGTLDALLVELASGAERDAPSAVAAAIRRRNPACLHLFLVAEAGYGRLTLGTYGAGEEFLHIALEPGAVRASDLDALEEMVPGPAESGLELALRHARALDRSRITNQFFTRFRAHRDAVAEGWTGLATEALRERRQLALLFLSRLTFLYFLQRRGVLAGDTRYVVHLYGRHREPAAETRSARETFYRAALVPLFFGALNRRPADRSPTARALGALPYLNGGLFEPHALERTSPELDLPDGVVSAALFGLLERYRFTTREAGDGAAFGIDPEMLGRVFEGLMEADRREATGSFYTPAPVVRRVVAEGVAAYLAGHGAAEAGSDPDGHPVGGGGGGRIGREGRYRARRALERIRVLDPACGSGAFLLGALHELTRRRAELSGEPVEDVRRDVVARSLHGVDLLDDAALLCALRLWLSLSRDGEVRPLPNLDRRVRQGDALIDPLELVGSSRAGPWDGPEGRGHPLRDPAVRRAARAVPSAARRYLDSGPGEREEARAALERAERELAGLWVARLERVYSDHARELAALATDRDLFGDVPEHARRAGAERARIEGRLLEVRRLGTALEEDGALPFFSFGVHFADAGDGFDLILSNPPWVRSHRWPDRLRRTAVERFEVCRCAGWPDAAELTGSPAAAGAQVDLALLFVERCLRLLAPGGVLAVLVPAKALRALYGGGLRRILLRDFEIVLLEDHALDHRAMFRADAFPAVLIVRRPSSPGRGATRVRLTRRGAAPLEFRVAQADMPLVAGDPASPWVLAPPDALAAIRAMRAVGPPLGRHPGIRVRRGVMTGANRALVLTGVEPKLGGLARIEAEGYGAERKGGGSARAARRFRAYVETGGVRPLVRGADIAAFTYRTDRYVVWCHDYRGRPSPAPRRLARYLERHRSVLERRPGWRPGMPLGSVFRVSPQTLRPKVAWHDLAPSLAAVALPARVPFDGAGVELVPLNTVYFLPVEREADALLLAGILNSLPVRTFARAIAERAKDARFRFFAWTVSCVPLPRGWRDAAPAGRIRALSERAHARGGIAPGEQRQLDDAVSALYGLDGVHVAALRRFDRWLGECP